MIFSWWNIARYELPICLRANPRAWFTNPSLSPRSLADRDRDLERLGRLLVLVLLEGPFVVQFQIAR